MEYKHSSAYEAHFIIVRFILLLSYKQWGFSVDIETALGISLPILFDLLRNLDVVKKWKNMYIASDRSNV